MNDSVETFHIRRLDIADVLADAGDLRQRSAWNISAAMVEFSVVAVYFVTRLAQDGYHDGADVSAMPGD
ncbi:hypothetical protein D3C80_1998420 [compost metagenome]